MTKQKLATARRAALLDEKIAPPQREAVAEDKSAVAVQIEDVKARLAEAEQKLLNERATLEMLVRERAQLACDKKPVNEIGDKIRLLEQSIEQAPPVFACLRERLADLQNEQRQIERDHNLSLQKDAAHQMERLSVVLVEQLRQALDTNQTLLACSRNYCKLREATGVDVVSSKVCQGSDGSLQALYETCKQEIEGKRGCRQPMSPGVIPI